VTPSPWKIERDSLDRALAEWKASDPSPFERDRVNDWLIEFSRDPLRRGREDPDHPGVYFGRVHQTNVGVLFVLLDADEARVSVISISHVD
jgi:hypothetical protein